MRDKDFSDNKERYYKRKFYSGYADDEVTYFFDYAIDRSYLPGFLFSRRRLFPHLLLFGINYKGIIKKSILFTMITSLLFDIFWLLPLYFSYYIIIIDSGLINQFPPIIKALSVLIPIVLFFVGDYIMMPRLVEIESFRKIMDRFILRKLIAKNYNQLSSRNPSSKFHKSNN